jgi:hypothetical protein
MSNNGTNSHDREIDMLKSSIQHISGWSGFLLEYYKSPQKFLILERKI